MLFTYVIQVEYAGKMYDKMKLTSPIEEASSKPEQLESPERLESPGQLEIPPQQLNENVSK